MIAPARVVPSHVSLDLRGSLHAVRSLELCGDRALITTPCPLALQDLVRLRVSWSDGSSTTLPARVRSLFPSRGAKASLFEQVAQVDVEGVEGDWRSFLAYLAPTTALAS